MHAVMLQPEAALHSSEARYLRLGCCGRHCKCSAAECLVLTVCNCSPLVRHELGLQQHLTVLTFSSFVQRQQAQTPDSHMATRQAA